MVCANVKNGAELISWSRVFKATQEDQVLVRAIEAVERGMPDSSYDMEKDLRIFHQFRQRLHVVRGVLCYKNRIIILQGSVLAGIHAAHQGVTGMTGRINDTVFWPGIHTDIIKTRAGCETCMREAPSQPAGFPNAPPSPEYPFQMIVADYFSLHGDNFLIIADRFTGWQQVYPAPPGKFVGQHFTIQVGWSTASLRGRASFCVKREDNPFEDNLVRGMDVQQSPLWVGWRTNFQARAFY